MLKLHFAPNSRAGRIVWLLEELGLEYEINKMAFHPKDLKSDEHRSRHPLGRIPVLEDGDLLLWESGAIVEYILERYENGGLKPPVDDARWPKYQQWFHYCEGMVMPPVNTIVVQTVLLPPDRRESNGAVLQNPTRFGGGRRGGDGPCLRRRQRQARPRPREPERGTSILGPKTPTAMPESRSALSPSEDPFSCALPTRRPPSSPGLPPCRPIPNSLLSSLASSMMTHSTKTCCRLMSSFETTCSMYRS